MPPGGERRGRGGAALCAGTAQPGGFPVDCADGGGGRDAGIFERDAGGGDAVCGGFRRSPQLRGAETGRPAGPTTAPSRSCAAIACSISRADLLGLPAIALPCLVAAALPLAINWLLGTWIYRSSGLDLATCLFGSVPAGISDMALVCLDMGGDAPKVAVLHMVRYIGLIAVMPGVIALLVSWLD